MYLQIHYDGSNSYIEDIGLGQLYIRGSAALHLESADGSQKYARFVNAGAAELYHNGTKAFETTSIGIDVPLGTITGPATLNIDPAAVGDNTGTVVIKGDLQVDGTTTTINSTTLTVDDKNIVLASGAANSAAADGAGITIDGANQTFIYESAEDCFKTSTRLGVRATPNINSNLRIGGNAGGEGNGTTYYALLNNAVFQSDVTTTGYYNFVQTRTGDNGGIAYTISNIEGYTATVGSGTISADSTITNLTGFSVKNSWIEGTNNYGFRGQIPDGTDRWNVYMDGTAPNYFAGDVGIGTTNPRSKFHVEDATNRGVRFFSKSTTGISAGTNTTPIGTFSTKYDGTGNGHACMVDAVVTARVSQGANHTSVRTVALRFLIARSGNEGGGDNTNSNVSIIETTNSVIAENGSAGTMNSISFAAAFTSGTNSSSSSHGVEIQATTDIDTGSGCAIDFIGMIYGHETIEFS